MTFILQYNCSASTPHVWSHWIETGHVVLNFPLSTVSTSRFWCSCATFPIQAILQANFPSPPPTPPARTLASSLCQVILPLLFVSLVLQVLKNPASQKWVMISPWHYVFKAVCYAVFFPKIIIYILFAGQEVRIGKNCSWGLEYDGLRPYSRLRVHFPNTDWLRPVNNMFIFLYVIALKATFVLSFNSSRFVQI